LIEGVSPREFEDKFGVAPEQVFGHAITRHLATGLLERANDRLRLTPRGQLLANEVFVDLLPERATGASASR
jgi:oxygen-independent coproporphyrinogen-3 oxidase